MAASGRKPTTEKVKIAFSKWSLYGQLLTRSFQSYTCKLANLIKPKSNYQLL
jgi:hypothetical protein